MDTPSPPVLPPRCDAAELSAVLVAMAQPQSRLVLDWPLDLVAGPVSFTTGRLWWLQLWDTTDQLAWTMAARSPDGRTWRHGCQRHWTTSGEVIEPLNALTPLERHALRERLQCAVSWPMPESPTDQAVMTLQAPVEQAKPIRRCGRGRGGKR